MEGIHGSSSALRKYLEQHLHCPEATKGRVFCHLLSDSHQKEQWDNEPIGPQRTSREYLHSRHTILVFLASNQNFIGTKLSPSASPIKKRNAEYVVVLGMTTWEYSHIHTGLPTRAYIQYVDTTGLFRPRKLQGILSRSLISAYFGYCRDILKVSFVHLFAHSKPSLMFTGSELLSKKRILDSGRLLNWWISIITKTFSITSDNRLPLFATRSPVIGHVHCVCEEVTPSFVSLLKENLEVLNKSTSGIQWVYDTPYNKSDSMSVIPLFEDDPKWKHYEASSNGGDFDRPAKRTRRENADDLTVSEFFQTMSYRSEFYQEPSAFIVIKFPENDRLKFSTPVQNDPRSFARKNDMATVSYKLLTTMSFDSELSAAKSSVRLWALLKIMGSQAFEVSCIDLDVPMSDLMNQMLKYEPHGRREDIHTIIPNDIQALIRRKVPVRNLPNHHTNFNNL